MRKPPNPIEVTTLSPNENGVLVSETHKTIDVSSKSNRMWLHSHCMWAMGHGRIIVMKPL